MKTFKTEKASTALIPRYVFWSGGADSTYMLLRLLEEDLPVTEIFFSDTGMEFDIMYEYIEKVESFIEGKYGRRVIHLHPKKEQNYKQFSRGTGIIRGKEQVRGIPRKLEPCWLQRNAKIYPFDRWKKENRIGEHLIYIGYTASELKRAGMKSTDDDSSKLVASNHLYPLILWGVTNNNTKEELQKMGMLNPLYEHFDRTGCFMCPKVGIQQYYTLWRFYPDTWKWLRKEEKKLRKLGNVFNSQFSIEYSIKEMEKIFSSGVYDLETRNTKDSDFCFCII